jgi:pilus assembly protein CpaB
MLQPGDRIDLMLTARAADSRNDGHDQTIVLMQDVLILATGRQVHPDLRGDSESSKSQDRQFGAITIEVDPDRAQRLIVAQRSGRITAILRNPTDRGAIPKAAMDVNALLGGARVPSGLRWPIPPEMIVGGQGVVMASSALSPLVALPLAPAGRPTPIGPTPSPATPAPAIPTAPGVIP